MRRILTVRRTARQVCGADAKARERREVTFARLCCRWRDGDKPPRIASIQALGLRKQAELQILGA
jgi:hypothetical protein